MSLVPATVTTTYPGQQQVVVVQQAPVRQGPRIYDKFAAGQSKALGILQVVMGILAIFFNALAIHFTDHDDEGFSYSGLGIWSGLWFILTGSFGIGAAQSKTMCPIVTCLVLSIISVSTWNLAFLALAAAGLGTAADEQCSFYILITACEPNHSLVAMMALLLIICLTEFVVAIWHTVICSMAVCCSNERSNTTAPVQFVSTTQGGQVMVMQNGPNGYVMNQGGSTVVTNTVMTTNGYPQQPAYQGQVQQNAYPAYSVQTQQQQPPQQYQGSAPAGPSSGNPAAVPAPPSYESGPPPSYASGPATPGKQELY